MGAQANDAHTVYTIDGPSGTFYGWAVSELADVDGDGVTDWITGAILDGDAFNGSVEIRSGATGAVLTRRAGDSCLATTAT